MIYKGIERLYADSTPLRKKVEDYGSVVSAYLSLKKATSLYCHLIDVGKERATCTKQVELKESHLAMVRADLDALQQRYGSIIQRIADLKETLCLAQGEECQLKEDIATKSLELPAAERELM